MNRAFAFLLALLIPALALAEEGWNPVSLDDLGLKESTRRYHTGPELELPFAGRSDRVLTEARLRLVLSPEAEREVRSLEIRMNGEPVTTLQPKPDEGRKEQLIEIDPKLVGDENVLSLRITPVKEGACGEVPAGTWKLIEEGTLETRGTALALPDDLSLLPLPFFDRHFDRSARIPVVLPKKPTADQIRLAGIFAGWLGLDTGLAMEFPVSLGELPDGHAVVLADGAAAAEALGLPAPEGPSLRIVANPLHPDSGAKVLIVGGRTPEELEAAVRRLAAGVGRLEGPMAILPPPPVAADRQPYDAPRWARASAPITLGEIAPGDGLVHRGAGGGTIAVRFRLPPDLFAWPAEWVDLDLRYAATLPQGVEPPRLDAEFNGNHVATLPALGGDGAARSTRLHLHRDHLRGYNELLVHVTWPEGQACGVVGGADAEIRLLPDSVFHVEKLRHFARLPDVASFVHDGFPFTRMADLSETAVVLPDEPAAAEISSVLSVLAHLASVTGEPGSRLTVLSASSVGNALDKDLLVVGLPDDHPLIRRWSDRLPLVFGAGRARVQLPVHQDALLDLLAGNPGSRELDRAVPVVARAANPAAVMGMESPLHEGRSVVVLTAGRMESLPGVPELRGFAESRTREGDLLLLSGGKRWSFRIGPTYQTGTIDRWTGVRWFLAQHWMALLGCMLLGALALAWPVRGALQRRADRRLSVAS